CVTHPGSFVEEELPHAAVDVLEVIRNRAQTDAMLAIVELHAMWIQSLGEHRRRALTGHSADAIAGSLEDPLLCPIAPLHAQIQGGTQVCSAAGPELVFEGNQLTCQPANMLEMGVEYILDLGVFALVLIHAASAHQIEEIHAVELRKIIFITQ